MEVLERASERKFLAVASLDPTVPYWIRNRLELARLYRGVGRVEDARAIEADLLKLLALADSDHPVVRELRQPRES